MFCYRASIDWFAIARFETALSAELKLFTQCELPTTIGTGGAMALVQSSRLGVKTGPWQDGLGKTLLSSDVDHEHTELRTLHGT